MSVSEQAKTDFMRSVEGGLAWYAQRIRRDRGGGAIERAAERARGLTHQYQPDGKEES